MEKISIIIPVYNVEKYLSRCLDSVISQSFSDWEAICVNDGSSDKSEDILRQYVKKDPRFKMIKQKNQRLCAGDVQVKIIYTSLCQKSPYFSLFSISY